MSGIRQIDLKEISWRDQRGWGTTPLEAAGLFGVPLGNLHIASLTPGSVRGNHYHTSATEWLLVCGGPAKIGWRPCGEDAGHEILVSKDEPALFEIPSNIEHAILNISDVDVIILAFSDSTDRETVSSPPLFSS